MLKNVLNIIFIGLTILLISCSDDIVNNNNPSETYVKVATAENGNLRFEIWSSSGDSILTGYNKIGFKVFENNQAKTSGYVKFYTKMYHSGGGNLFHGTPVEPFYNYNSQLDMFTGYIILMMPSDTSSLWYGYYNYNDQLILDSAKYDVAWNKLVKFKIFTDLSTSLSYLITTITPLKPVKGINVFQSMLHESADFISFTQVNNAYMYLTPHLDSLNHFSENNVNPVNIGGGIYEGKLNFDYSGLWRVNDSIIYNNKCITETDPPVIVFIVP